MKPVAVMAALALVLAMTMVIVERPPKGTCAGLKLLVMAGAPAALTV